MADLVGNIQMRFEIVAGNAKEMERKKIKNSDFVFSFYIFNFAFCPSAR